MISSIRIRSWHVLAAFAASAVLVASFLAFGAAQTSGNPVNAGVPLAAPYSEPIPAYASYRGWGQVSSGGYYANSLRAVPVIAWHWNGSGWVQRSRYVGARVYIYPYASGWSWTWSESAGWLAMRTNQLTIGYQPQIIAT